MVEQTRRPRRVIALQAGPSEVDLGTLRYSIAPPCSSLIINTKNKHTAQPACPSGSNNSIKQRFLLVDSHSHIHFLAFPPSGSVTGLHVPVVAGWL